MPRRSEAARRLPPQQPCHSRRHLYVSAAPSAAQSMDAREHYVDPSDARHFRTKDCTSAKSEGWVSVRDQQERIGNDSQGPSAYPYYEIKQ
jgi:hypothetical protein